MVSQPVRAVLTGRWGWTKASGSRGYLRTVDVASSVIGLSARGVCLTQPPPPFPADRVRQATSPPQTPRSPALCPRPSPGVDIPAATADPSREATTLLRRG